jgi:Tfp pilus assembly protein PilV
VEVLVAIMLLGTAVLSTLSVHGAVTQLSARAHQRRQLAIAAGSALDSLRSIPCVAALPGAVSTQWGHIAWSVITRRASRTVHLVATPLAGFPWRAETAIPCA